MNDEVELLTRRGAYIDQIRGLYRRERLIGFVGCLVGVMVMLYARYRPQTPHWLFWAGIGIIVASWSLFAYVIFRRTHWVRTHPFDPNG